MKVLAAVSLTFGLWGCSKEVTGPNRAPVANAGEDQTVSMTGLPLRAEIRLDGSRSYDPDGDDLTYGWEVLVAPKTVQEAPIIQNDLDEATVTVEEGGVWIFGLVVKDDSLASKRDVVEVKVGVANPCQGETVCAGQHRVCVNQNGAAVCGACLGGYHDDGGTCELDQTCQANSCSGHGSCSDQSGQVVCTCEGGYTGVHCEGCASGYVEWPASSGVCVDNPCLPDPCAAIQHAAAGTCVQTDTGVFRCACEAQYQWNAGQCIGNCTDSDGDGYGVGPGCAVQDCDDTRSSVHPGASESRSVAGTCTDGLDNDCDGQKDALDSDCSECNVPSDCDDNKVCTDDSCNNHVCGHTNNTVGCNDNDACTCNDACRNGLCSGISSVHTPLWYDCNWLHRRSITIHAASVVGFQFNFPLLINLASDPDLSTDARSDGYDILFTSTDGRTKLSHEIESFTKGSGALVAWVKVPFLSSGVDTVLYLYYGNPSSPNQQDPTGVWDADYKGVWHLKEDPSGAAPQVKDSTSNGNHATSAGGVVSSSQVGAKVNGGLDFDGNDDCLATNYVQTSVTAYTIEVWIRSPSTSLQRVIVQDRGPDPGPGRSLTLSMGGTYGAGSGFAGQVSFAEDSASIYIGVYSNRTVNDNLWHHVVGTWSAPAGAAVDPTQFSIYIDGALVTTNNQRAGACFDTSPLTGSGGTTIGYHQTWGNYFPGQLDEVRISNIARSREWISTEYNNQSSPSTFHFLGSEESYCP
jgi:hypothetical protein